MSAPRLALKVDIDTYAGMRDGVPAINKLLRSRGIRATFFVACGPDHSGRAIRRIFRKGFLHKMIRTNAPKLYGWRTLLYGTILPGPQIAQSFASQLRDLDREHVVGVHGYDHVYWQDRLAGLDSEDIEAELWRGLVVLSEILHRRPHCFAAPGWQCNDASLDALANAALDYQSNTRGRHPYIPIGTAGECATPEIPTTWPTLDEIIGTCEWDHRSMSRFYESQIKNELNVHTIHAEVEGTRYLSLFEAVLDALRDQVDFVTLDDVAQGLQPGALPRCRIVNRPVFGRSGSVATQATER